MITKSLSAVGIGLGILCVAISVSGVAPDDKSGYFAIAGSILIGSSLISLAIEGKK